ncbi:unnamed protein product [Mycena citricolor]|uniref:F-box domain-containing protein n=1 Tax=Mycena citricolor TaxID=2018698 RepID=A0AAD2HPQ8_9AGAR|nr:unnamed protein product [Mycena citricolor]
MDVPKDCFPAIARLPSELLSVIFQHLVVELNMDDFSRPAVMTLSEVSKHFRAVVLGTPTLWASIRLHSYSDLQLLDLFIHRSQSCLLDVSLDLTALDVIPRPLIASASRWLRISVRASDFKDIYVSLLPYSHAPVSELRELRLLPTSSYCDSDEDKLNFNAPKLRSLAIHGCLGYLAPLPGLTTLVIYRLECSYRVFCEFIQSCAELSTLVLQESIAGWETHSGDRNPTPITLEKLRVLAVSESRTPADGMALLDYLCVPNVQLLELSGSGLQITSPSNGDERVMNKSFQALCTLVLQHVDFEICDLFLFRSLSTITRMELSCVLNMTILTAPLAEGGDSLWPHLNTIVCDVSEEDNLLWLDNLRQAELRQRGHLFKIQTMVDSPTFLTGENPLADQDYEDGSEYGWADQEYEMWEDADPEWSEDDQFDYDDDYDDEGLDGVVGWY